MAPPVVERTAVRAIEQLIALDTWLARPAVGDLDRTIDPRTLPWTPAVAAAWPEVRAELDALLAEGHRLPLTDDVAGTSQGGEGEWSTLVMTWFGRWVDETCRRCPETARVLRAVPDIQVGGFTVLGPGAHLPRHEGPTHSIRYHLGVRVPDPPGACRLQVGSEVVVWEERGELAFDDRAPHEAWNESDERRYVLFVQTRLPVRGWRGLAHRATQQVFGLATSGIRRRAARFDRELNAR